MTKPLTSNDLHLRIGRVIGGRLRSLFDALHGRSAERIDNAEGTPLLLEGAIMREGLGHYTLAIRFGELVIFVENIPSHDSFARSLPMQSFGTSPAEVQAKERQRQAEREAMTPEQAQEETRRLYESWGSRIVKPGSTPVTPPTKNHPDLPVI